MAGTEKRKTVLITGCTPGGIGHALCKEFHARGLHVIATARRLQVLDDLKEMGMSVAALDVTSAESIAACKREVQELTGGRLDILVNNAGVSHTVPATDIDMDGVRRVFETNVFGIMAMVQAFTPLLIQARGHIIMISSLASIIPYIFRSVYCATKGALNSYSRTLRQELRPFGVRVTVSLTGTVKSRVADSFHSLGPNSIYFPIKKDYDEQLKFSQNNSTMNTAVFARRIVNDALRGESWLSWLFGGGPSNWIWAGGMSTKVWLARLLFGEWLLDRDMYRRFNLQKLAASFQKQGIKQA